MSNYSESIERLGKPLENVLQRMRNINSQSQAVIASYQAVLDPVLSAISDSLKIPHAVIEEQKKQYVQIIKPVIDAVKIYESTDLQKIVGQIPWERLLESCDSNSTVAVDIPLEVMDQLQKGGIPLKPETHVSNHHVPQFSLSIVLPILLTLISLFIQIKSSQETTRQLDKIIENQEAEQIQIEKKTSCDTELESIITSLLECLESLECTGPESCQALPDDQELPPLDPVVQGEETSTETINLPGAVEC